VDEETSFKIFMEDNELKAQLGEQPAFTIYPESETEFFYKVVDAQIEFILDKDKKASKLKLYQNDNELEAVKTKGKVKNNATKADTLKKYHEEEIILDVDSGKIYGTLLLPENLQKKKLPVALIIAGSGPTDRDGNSTMGIKCNAYKMLADSLSNIGIATVRYDKRSIGKSANACKNESSLRFENMIDDAAAWCNMLKKDARFNQVIIIGHSEGSEIGMIAAKKANADIFISLAGIATRADTVLLDQMNRNAPMVSDEVEEIVSRLAKGDTVDVKNKWLKPMFRASVQPYLISWFKYSPRKEIAKLTCPILIFQG
jgi:alpha/beta superfamily hydrolase